MAFDLILRNGRIIDPSQNLDRVADVAFGGGKVAAVGQRLDDDGTQVRDVSGLIVTPGLIDLHTHVYWGGTSLGIDAEDFARRSAVTTCVDTGSAGPGNFAGFRKHVIERSAVRILPYLHVSFAGIYAFSKRIMVGEGHDIRLLAARDCIDVVEANRDLIVGIKVRIGRVASGTAGIVPLDVAEQVADETGLPMMVHIDEPPPSYDEVVARLRPGDVLTHCFRPFPNAPIDGKGKIKTAVLAARQRGVIFDLGHGKGSFGWKTARVMLAEGFVPDTISSDIHALCIDGPVYDQVTTLSKFLALGMRLRDVIAASTVNAAQALNRPELGTLKPGSLGDASILSLEEGEFPLEDVVGEVVTTGERLFAKGVVIGGRWWHPLTARTLRFMDTLQNFIDGRWTAAPERWPAINPATGKQIAWLPKSDRAIAREAIAAAKQARAGWAKTSVWKRAEMCVAIAASIDESRARIARTLSQEQGKPLAQATGEVAKAADGFRLAAELVRQMKGETLPAEDPTKLVMTLRQPRGVYAVITPWNYPVNIPVEYLGPGLATGNTIVWVPAPTTSMAAVELMRAIEAAGLPAGVLNLVIGEGPVVGDEIVSHPGTAGIGFTGSAATGRRIAERGAGKPMLLELGGNGPLLVFEDADLKRAATAAANGSFSNAGQICAATGRVLAHESVADELAERIAGHARNYLLGDPLHQGVTMGPLNNPKVAAKVREHVDDAVAAGASVVTGGKSRPDLGSELFFEPTVLTGVTREMRINREETFGPVTPILSFRDDDEAMSLALDSEYGLSVGVFTRDMDRALRFAEAIPAGIVNINDSSTYWEIHLPFGGGSGTRSGVGRLGGRLTLEAMTEIKMITVTRAI